MELTAKEVKNFKLSSETKAVAFKSSDHNPGKKSHSDFSQIKILENLYIKIFFTRFFRDSFALMCQSKNDAICRLLKSIFELAEAKKLVPGSRDVRNCYCSVQLDCEEIYKTHVVEKTVSPYFQEEFDFDIPHKFQRLCFYLHDLQDDVLTKRDTVFAKVVIKKSELSNYNGVEHWFPLCPVENRSEVQGQIYIELKFQQLFALTQNSGTEDCYRLSVKIPKCNGLFMSGSNCDRYVSVTIQGKHRSDTKKSRVHKSNLNPSFDEEFVFELNKNNSLRRSWFDLSSSSNEVRLSEQEHWSTQTLKIAMYSAGTLGDIFMGEVKIPLSKIDVKEHHCAWYLLNARETKTPTSASKDEFGSLRIKITYSKDVIFPSETYNDLLQHLLDSAKNEDSSCSWPTLIGAICGSRKQIKAAESLVHVFLHQGQLLNLILPLADEEIANTKNLSSIFRGSTFTAFIIEESLRVIGKGYLRNVFSSTMERINSESKACEIIPSRLPQTNHTSTTSLKSIESSSGVNETLRNNMINLWEYVQLVLDNIVTSSSQLPSLLCEIFTGLRNSATKHFPDDVNIRYRVVTNFLFLRSFSSVFLSPRKHKILTEEQNPTTTRTFTLILKILQHMCNLSLPQHANSAATASFLKNFSNEFVKPKHLESIRNFIDSISTASTTVEKSGTSSSVVEKVILKEGEMMKRDQGRTILPGKKNFKTRFFALTNHELTYSKHKKSKPLCVIPVHHIKGVEVIPDCSMPYMFQIMQSGRVMHCKAKNSVDHKEWINALTKVSQCTKSRYYPGTYIEGKYTWLPASVRLNVDQDRDLERLYVMLHNSVDNIQKLQEECGARAVYVGPIATTSGAVESDGTDSVDENESIPLPKQSSFNIRDARLTFRTLCSILDCTKALDAVHEQYEESMKHQNSEQGTKDRPYDGW